MAPGPEQVVPRETRPELSIFWHSRRGPFTPASRKRQQRRAFPVALLLVGGAGDEPCLTVGRVERDERSPVPDRLRIFRFSSAVRDFLIFSWRRPRSPPSRERRPGWLRLFRRLVGRRLRFGYGLPASASSAALSDGGLLPEPVPRRLRRLCATGCDQAGGGVSGTHGVAACAAVPNFCVWGESRATDRW